MSRSRNERIVLGLRVAGVLAALGLSAGSGLLSTWRWSLLVLVVVAVLVSLPLPRMWTPPAALLEAFAIVSIAALAPPVGAVAAPVLICWLAPGLAAGIRGGYRWALLTAGLPLGFGLVVAFSAPSDLTVAGVASLLQWAALAAGSGLMGGLIAGEERAREDPTARSYSEAVRVLTELEGISRQLPTGFDVGGLAQKVLDEMIAVVPCGRCMLLTRGSDVGYDLVAWHPESASADDWLGDHRAVDDILADDGHPTDTTFEDDRFVLVPLSVGESVVAVAVLVDPAPLDEQTLARLTDAAQRGAVPLQAALLFDNVHDLATSEERRRIAREIHDGIAQDIAFLGYTADEIVDVAPPGEMRDLGVALRTEISRVLGELRESLFMLRDAVPGTRTLGSSISDYARRLFQDDEIQVHVVLEESARRLRPAVETELLRIAQEALTNARRHSGARNLWVECRVSAPQASLSVADDGVGLNVRGSGGFGLEIMAERARRIRADFTVSARPEGGTLVQVEVR